MKKVLRNVFAISPRARLVGRREAQIPSTSKVTLHLPMVLQTLVQPGDTPLCKSSYASPGPGVPLAWLQITRWVALALLSRHYIIVEFLARQLASSLLVFIICFKKERGGKERKKEDNLHFLIQSQSLFITACTSLIKMINECIVTEP